MSDTVAADPTAHELLLALAGWVDDDLLATGRELVAVGEEVPAIELLVASLAAGRTALPVPVRAAVVDAAAALRVEPPADHVLSPGVPPGDTAHRFAAGAGLSDVAVRIAGIATNLPVVGRSGARVSLAWRLTPAGAAPGPLPHPVLLVTVRVDGPVEVLAYQLGAALARAGVPASVEAFVDGTALPPYHLAALAEAVPLDPVAEDPAAGPTSGPPTAPAEPGSAPEPALVAAGPVRAGAGPPVPGPDDGGGGPGPHGARRDLTDTDPPTPPPASETAGGPGPGDPADRGPGDGPADRGSGGGATAAAVVAAAGTAGGWSPRATDRTGPTPVAGPSGSPTGPAPGAGPFDDGRAQTPGHGTAAPHPPRPRDGAGPGAYPVPADDVPNPGPGTPMDGHPAPRPAPRRVAPVPQSAAWFSGPDQGHGTTPGVDADPGIGPGPAVNGLRTPAEASRPGHAPDPVTSTGPITLPRPQDALNGPLERPLLDPRLDRADGAHDPGDDERGYGAASADPATGAYPGEDTWDRDWATGAWTTSGADIEPVTGPTSTAGPQDDDPPAGTRPALRSVSGPPPILRAPTLPRPGPTPSGSAAPGPVPSEYPAPGPLPSESAAPDRGPVASGPSVPDPGPVPSSPSAPGPAPVPPGPSAPGPAPLRPTPAPRVHDREGAAASSAPPEAVGPSGPRHRLSVPDPDDATGATGGPADAAPATDPDTADLRTEEQPAAADALGRAGTGPVEETSRPETSPDAPHDRLSAHDAPTEAPPSTPPVPSTWNRDTDARAQHPAAQHPTTPHPTTQHPPSQPPTPQHPAGRSAQDPSGNGRRPTPRPARGDDPGPTPGPDLGGRLTPNEQQLLRRLQEELAAREDGSSDEGRRNGSAHPDAG